MRRRKKLEFYIIDNNDGTYSVEDEYGTKYEEIFMSEMEAQHWIDTYDDGYDDYIYDMFKDMGYVK